MALTRRHLARNALAVAAALPFGAGRAASAAASAPRLSLPRPTGPFAVGTVPLRLVDDARGGRELMVSIWYPARDVDRHPRTLYLTSAPMRELLVENGLPADVASAPLTAGHEGAPVRRAVAGCRWSCSPTARTVTGPRPPSWSRSSPATATSWSRSTTRTTRTSSSPTAGSSRSPTTTCRSRRGTTPTTSGSSSTASRTSPPGATRRRPARLPAGLGAALDPRRIGMFGWSKGATATALVHEHRPAGRAGLSFDGPMQSQPPVGRDLDRPFMLMTAEFTRAEDAAVAEFWPLLPAGGSRCTPTARPTARTATTRCADPAAGGHDWDERRGARAAGSAPSTRPGRYASSRRTRWPSSTCTCAAAGSALLDGPSRAFPEVHVVR